MHVNMCRETGLIIAARHGHEEIAKRLIRAGATINPKTHLYPRARTALQAACEGGHVNITIILINHNASVNAAGAEEYGVTALQAAAIKGYFRICQILIGCGARVSAPASRVEGRTAIDGAAEHGRLDVVKYLLDRYDGKEEIVNVCQKAREFALREGHIGVVKLLDEYPHQK